MPKTLPVNETDDLLWKHLKTIPAFRGILRAVEARFYQQLDLERPILDVGCGDGHFAEVTFDEPLDVGIDPWWPPLQHSRRNETYDLLLQCNGDELPIPDGHFASAISNSVLEHIPDVQGVLNETSRVLRENGRFVVTMPCNYFNEYLGGVNFFKRMGADGMAQRYLDFATKISRHVHVNEPAVWAERFAQAGMEIERWQYYFSEDAVRALEIGHLQGGPSAVVRALTGHWIVAPWEDSLVRTERWLRPYYEEETAVPAGGYIFIVARKVANHPIEAKLPEQRPFTIAELMTGEQARLAQKGGEELSIVNSQLSIVNEESPVSDSQSLTNNQQSTANNQQSTKDSSPFTIHSSQSTIHNSPVPSPHSPLPNRQLLNYSILIASLLLAGVAQLVIAGAPNVVGRGVTWLVLAGLTLLFVGAQQGVFSLPGLPTLHAPTLRGFSPYRWLIVPALLLSLVARGLVAGGQQRPFPALLVWFVAMGVGYVALAYRPDAPLLPRIHLSRNVMWTAVTLFVVAVCLRLFDLTSHPFILNGIEASIGLDAEAVANGTLRNPFGVGWLTNTTLPSFILSLPIRIFGTTTFAIRILSPFVGALTVTAVYLIGRKLWDNAVGLIAAVLLTGSHFHLHYSRLGLHNIWEPLMTLLALGVMAIAWQADPKAQRTRLLWLLGGGLLGLNAYFFTPARVLPFVAVGLLLGAILFERERFGDQFRHLLAAGLLALVVALPQLLFYYNAEPNLFMERANVLGILPSQTGWLVDEAARQGVSETAVLRQQLWQAFTAFNGGLDRSPSYRPNTTLLTFGYGLFFLLGLLVALLKLREQRYRMLLLWVLTTMVVAGGLLLELPSSHRLVIATPALTLLAAVALVTYGRLLFNALPEDSQSAYRQWLLPAMLLVSLLFMVGDVGFYYGRYRLDNQFGDRNTEIADRMVAYLETQPEPTTAYFLGPPAMFTDFPTITYLAQSYQRGINLFDVAPDQADLQPAPTERRILIILPERAAEIDAFRVQYPNGELTPVSGVYADPLFYIYEVAP